MPRQWRSVVLVSTAACALVGAAACSDHRRNGSADSDLTRDLQLAGQISAPPAPTFQDPALSSSVPDLPYVDPGQIVLVDVLRALDVTPHPQPSAPIPSPAPASAPTREIGAGTDITMTSGGRVCTETNRPGDKIVATVDAPISGSNGALIPAGSKVVLEIASVTPGDQAQISFRVRALYVNDSSYSIAGTVSPSTPLERVKVQNPDANADKKKVIGGAIAGAILGQMIGHNTKGTVIGAATGAAAGAVAAKATEKYEACLPAGASLHMTLAQAVAM